MALLDHLDGRRPGLVPGRSSVLRGDGFCNGDFHLAVTFGARSNSGGYLGDHVQSCHFSCGPPPKVFDISDAAAHEHSSRARLGRFDVSGGCKPFREAVTNSHARLGDVNVRHCKYVLVSVRYGAVQIQCHWMDASPFSSDVLGSV